VGVGLTSGVRVGWRTEDGAGPPVDPIMPPKSDERKPPTGAFAEGVGATAEDVGWSMTALRAGAALETTDDAGTTISGIVPEDGRFCTGGEDDCEGIGGEAIGESSTSGCLELEIAEGAAEGVAETGGGDWRGVPVPERTGLSSGTGVTIISFIEVTVPDDLSDRLGLTTTFDDLSDPLELTTTFDDVSGRSRADLNSDERDGKSICRDSSSEDELEDVEEEDSVGAAGAVALVTICRLTCRG
jgi:hypothetical protein